VEVLQALYLTTRQESLKICSPLMTEDYVVQPAPFVSPPKWHLGHSTWFFEEFILTKFSASYKVFNDQFGFVFNSYYEGAGKRVVRTNRGNLSRPSVSEIVEYRAYVDQAMIEFLQSSAITERQRYLIEVGCNHEQQHQELLYTDIKYILGHNPLQPTYADVDMHSKIKENAGWLPVKEGLYNIGYNGDGFHYDNEKGVHQAFLQSYQISSELITNAQYISFIENGGYQDHRYWHSAGWAWVQENAIKSPMYWQESSEGWKHYTLAGLKAVAPDGPVTHISYYEAFAYAEYSGMRLPTEQEWEVASSLFDWGQRWEWTASAYTPYPNYVKEVGALGEYNGKFMVGQQVLRGASSATSAGHSRPSYRNFFHAEERWQFTGIRLVKKIE